MVATYERLAGWCRRSCSNLGHHVVQKSLEFGAEVLYIPNSMDPMEDKVIESRVTADKVFNRHQDRRARLGLWGAVLVMLGLSLIASKRDSASGP